MSNQIRTIKGWCAYDWKHKVIVTMKPSKWMVKKAAYPGCVIVQMKGIYAHPRRKP